MSGHAEPFGGTLPGGCAAFAYPPFDTYCEQEPAFAVKISGAADRKAVRACRVHLGDVMTHMIELHGGYRGEFTVRPLPAPDAPDL